MDLGEMNDQPQTTQWLEDALERTALCLLAWAHGNVAALPEDVKRWLAGRPRGCLPVLRGGLASLNERIRQDLNNG